MNFLRPSILTLALGAALSAQTSQFGYEWLNYGNDWLGGTAYANGSLSTSRTLYSENGTASFYIGADVKILKRSVGLATLYAVGSNTVQTLSFGQTASGRLQVRVLGNTLMDQSIRTTGQIGSLSRVFKIFPVDPTASAPVGPFTITLAGNGGAGVSASAYVTLPASMPEARLSGAGNAYAYGSARVSVGVAGFGAGLELSARLADQTLGAVLKANARTGVSGQVTYSMTALSLKLKAFLTALYVRVYETTLASWSWGQVVRYLISV